MKYNGIELKEITEPQIFDPPKTMLVWDEGMTEAKEELVCAILNHRTPACRIVGFYNNSFAHCAQIPEAPKPRRATWKELAYWLMDSRGLVMDKDTDRVDTGVFFDKKHIDEEVGERWLVMGKNDTEWHEPTADYLGMEE